MTSIALALALLLSNQEDELLRMFVQSSQWAQTLTAETGRVTRPRDIRRVSCVGLEMRYMLCSWEQRSLWRWRKRSKYADFSQPEAVRLLSHPISE